MSALTEQVGGSHYKDCKIQPAQYIEANNLKFLEGCVVKRVTRHDKPTGKGRQDIEKAIHELQLLLELRYGSRAELKDGYMLCPYCKEVTRKDVVACIQCGEAVNYDEARMDVIGQNGNDGEHYTWVEWPGGVQSPVPPGAPLEVRFRDGKTLLTRSAIGLRWRHDGGERDIVAYRLA